ncbi:hypothetical protein [Prevotella pallens]|uniref:Uncharacterized protein n=1 Tax=Prevotella pallens TaxID=60133 RepID=A0A379F195_9BACT|nr:hypothetical protein [Prevotella pallens]SUC12375.1 Uncharacterised protein [Prevotella pallens]
MKKKFQIARKHSKKKQVQIDGLKACILIVPALISAKNIFD